METDLLAEVETKIENIQGEDPDNLEEIEKLRSEHKAVLEQICERESAKLKTFKILEDEKPSKGMIALEKKLSGYTNVTMLYGPEETHSPPVQGGIPMDQSTNQKGKYSQIQKR